MYKWEEPEEDYLDYGDEFFVLVWPKDYRLPSMVPSRVAEIYAEAVRIKATSPNAFAVQIRRASEAICSGRGVPGGKLPERLEALAEKDELPTRLLEMTDALKLSGNIGAYGSRDEVVWSHDADTIDTFFNAVIEYLYITPSRLKEYRKTLEERRSFYTQRNGRNHESHSEPDPSSQ